VRDARRAQVRGGQVCEVDLGRSDARGACRGCIELVAESPGRP
jgi:hypothetical protein